MKKTILAFLLILSISALMALESAPSETVGFVKYIVKAGDYSMVSLPLDSGMTLASELATSIGADITSVAFYSGGWTQYLTSQPTSDFSISDGNTYFVFNGGVSDIDFYTYGGLITDPSYDIAASDYTLILLPFNCSDLTLASELATDIGPDVTSIAYYDSGWTQYLTTQPTTDFSIDTAKGFFIFSNTEYLGWNSAAKSLSKKTNHKKNLFRK